MKVHPSHTGETTAAHTGHAATKLASTSFASLLATTTASPTAPGTDAKTGTASAITLAKGESMKAVQGHAYAEISGGKRDGLYVNTTNNKRRGQAFVLVHRNGREYHIYGTGKDRVVVALRKPAKADGQHTAPANTATGTGGVTPTVSAS
jgi:hypothetical protein